MPKKETQSHRFVILEFMRMFACLCLSVIHSVYHVCLRLFVGVFHVHVWVGGYVHACVCAFECSLSKCVFTYMFKRICTRLGPLLVKPAKCQLLSAIIIISRGSNLSVDFLTTDFAENTDATMQNSGGVAWRGVATGQRINTFVQNTNNTTPVEYQPREN